MDGPTQADLLQELMAAQAQGAALPSPESLLADHPDPTVRLLAQLLSQRAGAEAAGAEEEDEEPPRPRAGLPRIRLGDDPDEEPRDDLRLRREVRWLRHELERLQEINDTLAAALGACPLCWGEDEECKACRGRGGPGGRRPDRALFTRFVAPAARRLEPAAVPKIQRRSQTPTERSQE